MLIPVYGVGSSLLVGVFRDLNVGVSKASKSATKPKHYLADLNHS